MGVTAMGRAAADKLCAMGELVYSVVVSFPLMLNFYFIFSMVFWCNGSGQSAFRE